MAPTEGQSEAHPDMPHYWWTVPQLPPLQGDSDGLLCVLRMRYNISTNDFPSMAAMSEEEVRQGRSVFDHRYNCPRVVETGRTEEGDEQRVAGGATDDGCVNRLMDGNRPRYNRPYVQVFADENSPRLSVALNTDQAGRTFQVRAAAPHATVAGHSPPRARAGPLVRVQDPAPSQQRARRRAHLEPKHARQARQHRADLPFRGVRLCAQ